MKKFLSLMLAMIMVMSLVTVGAGAADFTDEEKIQYNEAVAVMSELGILGGYTDGSFRPQNPLTRQVAAKIIAYIALGEDDAEDLICVEDPFSDVAATKTLAPYINWAAKEGIVTGYDDGTFAPEANVSGHAFLKMVLGALKIEGTYEGEGWRVNVTSAASEAGLFDGIDTNAIVLRNDATRELACQIAFNAMFYTAKAISYKVMDGETEVAECETKDQAELIMAMKVASGATGITIKEVKNEKDTLAYLNYELQRKTPAQGGVDEYGRPATVYTEDGDAIVYALETPVLTIKGAATEKEIFTALGKSGYQGKYNKFVVIKELWADGVKQFDVSKVDTKAKNYEVTVANYDAIGETNAKNFASIVKDDTSAWACGNGAVTEIYATSKGNEFKAVVTNEYLGYIDAAPVKANEKTGADRYVKIKVNGAVKNFETEEFAKKDYVLVTMKAGKIDTVKKVEGIKDVAVDKFIANESVTFGGETYKFSQNLASGTGFTNKADFENKDTFEFDPATYTFFLDSQGNVIGIEEYDAGDITDYAYIVKVQAQANEGATLLGSAEEDIVVAKVIFTDGTEKTVELKVTEENKVAKVMYPAADGSVTKAAVKDIADTENETPIENWFSYVKNDDGTYSFCEKEGNVDVADADVDLVKGEVGKINTDYLTTSKTTVTTISAAGALTKVTGLVKAELDLTVVENEGEEDEETYSNLILFTYDSNDFVTGIYAVMQANPVAATATDYVYALEQGAQLKNGVEWTFVENGQKVTYVIDENTPYIVEKGHVYTLTTEDGKIMANDVAADIRVVANIEVDLVDEAFVLVGTTPYYVTDKTAVYLVEDGEVGVDALVKDDVCTFVYALEDAEDEDSAKTLIAAYITKAK